ncbi:MAG: hypothetical protein AAFS04_07495 [Cyanobacteria bacterium J06631_9]
MKRLFVLLPVLLSAVSAPAIAGEIIVEAPETPSTVSLRQAASVFPDEDIFCRYTPTGNELSLFGFDTTITLTEINDNSTISLVQTAENFNIASANRSLIFIDTSVRDVEQRLINRPADYADLLGVSTRDVLVRRGFESISDQFACEAINSDANVLIASQRSRLRTINQFGRLSETATDIAADIAALPDGNYRFTIGAGSLFSEADSDSPRFTFRKLSNVVTGRFDYPEDGVSACVTGTVEGNTVIGQAFTNSAGTSILGQRYLGSSLSLRFEDGFAGNDASLDLSGFDRINAGSTLPPSSCF